LVPRLDRQQLVHVFQHELMHVRRRDYLWDRLSTLACYLVFFHPAAWWARRGLRWERELVCDESVAVSGKSRLEYASCLTTLAAWRYLGDNAAGQVDFLPSRSSLLAARVRALLADPRKHGPGKEIAVTVTTMCVLIAAARLTPTVVISAYSVPRLDVTVSQVISPPQARNTTLFAHRHQVVRQANSPPLRYPSGSMSLSLDLNVHPVMPTLSPGAIDPAIPPDPSEGDSQVAEVSFVPPGGQYFPRSRGVWDESRPLAPHRPSSKAGHLALRAFELGMGIVAAEMAFPDSPARPSTGHRHR
jgi:hypothetical protein